MIKIHCNHIGEFILAHVINWYVLCALTVPILFSLLFPVYWFIICPQIWAENPQLYNARSWLIAYWLFGIVVWLIFLFVVFYKSMRDHSNEISSSCHKGGAGGGSYAESGKRSDSSEDLWSEDQYLADSYLPSPDYMVSLNAVQPSVTLEDKQEVDETWDYNYEDTSPQNGSPSGDRFPLEQHYHSLGYINAKLQQGRGGDIWRKYSEPSPTFYGKPVPAAANPQYPHPIRFGKDPHTTTTTDDDDSVYDYRNATSSRRSRSGHPTPMHPGPPGSFHHPASAPRRPPSARHLRPLRYLNSPGYHRGRAQSTSTTTTTDSGADSPSGRYHRFLHNSRRRHAPTCPRSRHIPIPPVKKQVMITRPPAPPTKRISGTRSAHFASKEDSESDFEQMKRSVTSEELKCLQDVCQGKLQRKGSIVDDSKFDSILASLQSLASDLEKDFEYVPPAIDLKRTLEEERKQNQVQTSKKFTVSPAVLKSERTKSEGDFDDIPDSITTKIE